MKKLCLLAIVSLLVFNCQMFERHTVIEDNTTYSKPETTPPLKDIKKGKAIYNRDCAMCHSKDKKGIDLLKDIDQRMTKSYFALYITKHDSLRRSGDPYVKQMAAKWNDAAPKHDYTYSKEEMENLIAYAMQ